MITVQLYLDRSVNFPINPSGVYISDSKWSICFEPKDKVWTPENIQFIPTSGYWSLSITDTESIGFNGKSANKCNNDEIIKEIYLQLLNSMELNKIIKESNDYSFNNIIINKFIVERQRHQKFSLNSGALSHQVSNITDWSNLFLAGAHIQNSMNIWSMEGACESGLTVAKIINPGSNNKIHVHNGSVLVRFIRKIDYILYNMRLPNVLYTMIIIILIIILKIVFIN